MSAKEWVIMLSKTTPSSRTRDAVKRQESHHRVHTSDTWPPQVFDAVVDIMAQILVAEYQSTHVIGSSPRCNPKMIMSALANVEMSS